MCYAALAEAESAHRMTLGRFDPRILRDLQALGYDRSLPFGSGPVDVSSAEPAAKPTTLRFRAPWSPGFDPSRSAVRIGSIPVDLGGIGKGLAVRWASEALRGRADAFLVEAGRRSHHRRRRSERGRLARGGRGPPRRRGSGGRSRRHRRCLRDVVDTPAVVAGRRAQRCTTSSTPSPASPAAPDCFR